MDRDRHLTSLLRKLYSHLRIDVASAMLIANTITSTPTFGDEVKKEKTNPIRDIVLYESVLTAGSLLGYELGIKFAEGVGSDLRRANLARGLSSLAKPWDFDIKTEGPSHTDKGVKTFLGHPLIGYSYTQYLLNSGYSKKEALATSIIATYVWEKGIEGSYGKPSLQDFASYTAGNLSALLLNKKSRRLAKNKNFGKKLSGYAINPLLLFQE